MRILSKSCWRHHSANWVRIDNLPKSVINIRNAAIRYVANARKKSREMIFLEKNASPMLANMKIVKANVEMPATTLKYGGIFTTSASVVLDGSSENEMALGVRVRTNKTNTTASARGRKTLGRFWMIRTSV